MGKIDAARRAREAKASGEDAFAAQMAEPFTPQVKRGALTSRTLTLRLSHEEIELLRREGRPSDIIRGLLAEWLKGRQ